MNLTSKLFALVFCITLGLCAQNKPNVLLIVLDDLNDYVGVMGGHPQAKTPNIDALAKQGVLFTNAHSNVPVCSPSRASFMHGIHPTTSTYWGFGNWQKNELLMNSKSLPEYFRENGYKTYQSGKVFHTAKPGAWDELGAIPEYGPLAYNGKKAALHPSCPEAMGALGPLDATFASLADIPDVKASKDAPGYKGWWNTNWKLNKPFHYKNDEDRDLLTDEKSTVWFAEKIKALEAQDNETPFFIGVGFIRPHTPLVVPQMYFDRFPLASVQIPVLKENDKEDTKLEENTKGKEPRGRTAFRTLTTSYSSEEKALQTYLQAYLASVSFADDRVGEILTALNNSKYKDNTIVVLMSDHGYNMGEKEYLFKYCLWEESTHVPLIIKSPDHTNMAGKKVDHPVSLVDLYPTLQDACKLKGSTVFNSKGAPLDGASLMPFLEEKESWNGPDVALTVVSSWVSKKANEQHLAVRSKDFRYIHYANGAEELYDHKKDPYEWTNLAEQSKYKKVKKELNKQLFALVNSKKKAASTDAPTTEAQKKSEGEQWKDKYFKQHPEADTNKDGVLTWPEYKAHKNKQG